MNVAKIRFFASLHTRVVALLTPWLWIRALKWKKCTIFWPKAGPGINSSLFKYFFQLPLVRLPLLIWQTCFSWAGVTFKGITDLTLTWYQTDINTDVGCTLVSSCRHYSGLLSRGPLFAPTCHDEIFPFSFALKTSSLTSVRGRC